MLQASEISIPSPLYEKHATIYSDNALSPKACILYFHGGGLLYGSRDDLPTYHLEALCSQAYVIIALDYPLAPAAKISDIMEDVQSSISWYLDFRQQLFLSPLPYFLWGRSAGAYLCLLSLKYELREAPSGILSYYGYGLLRDGWFNSPNAFYNQYPPVSPGCLSSLSSEIHSSVPLETHFVIYVYLRQKGLWSSFFSSPDTADLLSSYSLRELPHEKTNCPIFFAHSTSDPDVPFAEFSALINKFPNNRRFVVAEQPHDFDRNTNEGFTKELLEESILFLSDCLKA